MRYIVTFFVCYSVCLTIALFLFSHTPVQSVIYAAVVSLAVAVSLKLVQRRNKTDK